MKHYTFTSESVTEGHPDKVADLISDTIADYIIDNNQSHRAAIETLVTTNKVCVSGEYKSSKNVIVNGIDLINNTAFTTQFSSVLAFTSTLTTDRKTKIRNGRL